jgi:putative nucleotidyltransferase with HDIG domain
MMRLGETIASPRSPSDRLTAVVQHGRIVGELAAKLAVSLGWERADAERVRVAGVLHDVGKLLVSAEILDTPGGLTEHQHALVKLHPIFGFELLDGLPSARDVSQAVLHHHERIDGRGYPLGLWGAAIPETARLIAVADAYDAMTSPRVYKQKLTRVEALRELANGAGSQFDARFVHAFCDIPAAAPEFMLLPPIDDATAALLDVVRARIEQRARRGAA